MKILKMQVKNAGTTSSESYQLRNVNNVPQESRNIAIQPGEIDYGKSEVIAFVVNAGMNSLPITFIF